MNITLIKNLKIVTQQLGKEENVHIIYLDLSKASDKIDHKKGVTFL